MSENNEQVTQPENNETGDYVLSSHTISIPNVDFMDVLQACVDIGLSDGRVTKSARLFGGQAFQTVDIDFETEEESCHSYLYALAEALSDQKVEIMIADGEIWENTLLLLSR